MEYFEDLFIFDTMIQVINRALDIIEYVSFDMEKPKLMGKIAEDLELNLGTCANIVKTLVNRGYLVKSEKEKGYILGDKVKELADGILGMKSILEKAAPVMEQITKLLGENCLIAVLKNNKRNVLQKSICDNLIQATTPDEKNAYDSSTGRLLIAMLPPNELKTYINQFGLPSKNVWPEACNLASFNSQVENIRSNGYSLIQDSVQIVGIATPIYKSGKVVASFSIYLPSFRFTETIKVKMIAQAIEAGKQISI